jgi:hypothetical protein
MPHSETARAGVVTERAISGGALMTRKTHDDPFDPSIEQVARALLEFARQEPALVGRCLSTPRPPAEARSYLE